MLRKALIVAPLYGNTADDLHLSKLSGAEVLKTRLREVLEKRGDYVVDTSMSDSLVTKSGLRLKLEEWFQTEGSLLFYFYGHGCLRRGTQGILATSDAVKGDEGISMRDLVEQAEDSAAHEIVVFLDCCHAGASLEPIRKALGATLPNRGGRALLASCRSHQQGIEVSADDDGTVGLSHFAESVMEGLEGAAARNSTTVNLQRLAEYVRDRLRSETEQIPVERAYGSASAEHPLTLTTGFFPGVDPKTFYAIYDLTQKQIVQVRLFKKLHDLLQDLVFALRTIDSELARESLVDDVQDWVNFRRVIYQDDETGVYRNMASLIEHAGQLSPARYLVRSLTRSLNDAKSSVDAAVENHDMDTLARAMDTLSTDVVPKQSDFDKDLRDTADQMNLGELRGELGKIYDSLLQSGDQATLRELRDLIEEGERLEKQLAELISKHELWQLMDDELRTLDQLPIWEDQDGNGQSNMDVYSGVISGSLTELTYLRRDLLGTNTEPWVADLDRAFDAVHSSFHRRDSRDFANGLSDYRSIELIQFKHIDTVLFTVCGTDLPDWEKRLAFVLKKIGGSDNTEPALETTGIGE